MALWNSNTTNEPTQPRFFMQYFYLPSSSLQSLERWSSVLSIVYPTTSTIMIELDFFLNSVPVKDCCEVCYCVWYKYSPVIFLWISGQYLPVSVQTTTSGAKNQGATEQKPNSSFPNIYQKVSEPEYRQYTIIIYYRHNLASTIILDLCHAHSSSVSHTVSPPSPTWWADVLLCETLSLGSHQRWRLCPWWWTAPPQPPAWSHHGLPSLHTSLHAWAHSEDNLVWSDNR